MNVTISVDDAILDRARRLARQRGVSLQELLRDYLRTLAGERSGEDVASELLHLMDTRGGRSGGRRFDRSEAYRERL